MKAAQSAEVEQTCCHVTNPFRQILLPLNLDFSGTHRDLPLAHSAATIALTFSVCSNQSTSGVPSFCSLINPILLSSDTKSRRSFSNAAIARSARKASV